MQNDMNILPNYMNHQVCSDDFNNRRGIGGDQFSMAFSSWDPLYGYSGNDAVKEEMKFIADSAFDNKWVDSNWQNPSGNRDLFDLEPYSVSFIDGNI